MLFMRPSNIRYNKQNDCIYKEKIYVLFLFLFNPNVLSLLLTVPLHFIYKIANLFLIYVNNATQIASTMSFHLRVMFGFEEPIF